MFRRFSDSDVSGQFREYMPFADLNENGIRDSLIEGGVSRGKWKLNPLESFLFFWADSAYRFVSDSGITYYVGGFGGDAHLMNLSFVQGHDDFTLRLPGFAQVLSRIGPLRVPSTTRDSVYYKTGFKEVVHARTRWPR